MHVFVCSVHCERLWTSSQIASIINVTFQFFIDTCKHPKAPNIKLSSLKQSRLLNILLYYKSATHIITALTNNLFDFLQFTRHSDPYASICIFTWLDDPHFFLGLGLLGGVMRCGWRWTKIAIVFCFITVRYFRESFSFLKFLQELIKNWILQTFTNVKS